MTSCCSICHPQGCCRYDSALFSPNVLDITWSISSLEISFKHNKDEIVEKYDLLALEGNPNCGRVLHNPVIAEVTHRPFVVVAHKPSRWQSPQGMGRTELRIQVKISRE